MTNPKTLLLPALLAAGTGIGASPARALELGEFLVDSTLGQPLRASIAYALAPNEQLAAYCVNVVPALEHGGVPAAGTAEVSVANGVLRLRGAAMVREPVVSLRLSIDCPYSPRLERQYTVFLDPVLPQTGLAAGSSTMAAEASARPGRTDLPAMREHTPAVAGPPARSVPLTGQAYRVRPGDSLSSIAGRIENRRVSLWSAVYALHAANPDAFIDNDIDRLKAGASLIIPDTVAGRPVREARGFATMPSDRDPAHPVALDTWAAATEAVVADAIEPAESDASALATARPGDIIVDGRALPAVESAADSPNRILIDQRLEASASSPNRPVAAIVPRAARSEPAGTSLWWMIGGGFLLLGGLLYVGFRSRPAAEPADTDALLRRAGDGDAAQFPLLEPLVAEDYELDDDSPTTENFILDANLEIGTDFDSGESELVLAEDFGFDTSSDLDLELPDDDVTAEEAPSTDVIPAPNIEQSMILEREVLPDDEDYDISVIMDATKVPDPSAVTGRDLKAVIVEDLEAGMGEDHYTVAQEVDYQALDHDYEDDLTASQALSLEIEKATAELALRLDAGIRAEKSPADREPDARVARVSAFDPQHVAGNDDNAGDLDITDSHPRFDTTISEAPTARLRALQDEAPETTDDAGLPGTKTG